MSSSTDSNTRTVSPNAMSELFALAVLADDHDLPPGSRSGPVGG
ncbi:MAG: hypothetical protein R2710_01955 [Acidimicrobiales bacterium]